MVGTTHIQLETHVISYETRSICITRGILIIKITTIITIVIVSNGREGGDTTRQVLSFVPIHTH